MDADKEILLVEDNEINQLVARQILTRAGYTCEVASSGEEALRRLETEAYRLILMDVQMPGLDGIETTKRIRSFSSDHLNAGVPIIAMTAYTTNEDRNNCSNAGMDDYITKPLQLESFVATVKKHLERAPDSTHEGSQPSESGQEPASAVFDLEDALRRTNHDQALVQRTVSMFLDSTPDRMHDISAACAKGEYQAAGNIAHNLHGAALNVSAGHLAHIATRVVHASRDGDRDALRETVQGLESEYERFRQAVRDAGLSRE
jgi:CheY-like chemotaxis protein/HPt (histidine-containing phosphotransfer) domain-containing protein